MRNSTYWRRRAAMGVAGALFLAVIGVVGLVKIASNPFPEHLVDLFLDLGIHLLFLIIGIGYPLCWYKKHKTAEESS